MRQDWLKTSFCECSGAWCVFSFLFLCYCFLSVYSKIPEERNDFDQNCSSKKKLGESLQTPQENQWEYDQGARKHIHQSSPEKPGTVIQDPQRQLRNHHRPPPITGLEKKQPRTAWLLGAHKQAEALTLQPNPCSYTLVPYSLCQIAALWALEQLALHPTKL